MREGRLLQFLHWEEFWRVGRGGKWITGGGIRAIRGGIKGDSGGGGLRLAASKEILSQYFRPFQRT